MKYFEELIAHITKFFQYLLTAIQNVFKSAQDSGNELESAKQQWEG